MRQREREREQGKEEGSKSTQHVIKVKDVEARDRIRREETWKTEQRR